MTTPDRISNLINTYRTSRDLSQADLAEEMGVSQMTVSRWERGTVPRISNLGPILATCTGNGQKKAIRDLLAAATSLSTKEIRALTMVADVLAS